MIEIDRFMHKPYFEREQPPELCEHPFHHHDKPRYTMTEEVEHATRLMRETIDRLLRFENRLKDEITDLSKTLMSDNVIFKNTMHESWNTFLMEVKNEVNIFESTTTAELNAFKTELESNYATLSEDVRKQILDNLEAYEEKLSEAIKTINERIEQNNNVHAEAFAEFQRNITTQLNTFEQTINAQMNNFMESVNTTLHSFKDAWESIIEQRLNSQDAKLADAEMYMKTNLTSTVTTLISDMHANGEFEDIIEGEVFNDLQRKVDGFGRISILYFGAVGDGVTDNTEAFNLAVACGKPIHIPAGDFVITDVNVSNAIDINGVKGNRIICKGAGFKFANAKARKSFDGLTFVCENGSAMTVTVLVDTSAYNTLTVKNCTFEGTPYNNEYAVKLYGENEAVFENCVFYGCSGVDIDSSINPAFSNCVFRHSNHGVNFVFSGSVHTDPGYTCGLRIDNCTFLGVVHGIYASQTDSVQVNNSMIDYCDNPIVMRSQRGFMICNSYVSSRNNHPAIYADNDGSARNEHIKIINCNVLTHVTSPASNKISAIELHDCDKSTISDSIITWFTANGVVLHDCTEMILNNLHFSCDSTLTNKNGIYAINSFIGSVQEDVSNNAYYGVVTSLPIFYHYARIRNTFNSAGFSDEARGSVVVSSGKTSHAVTVGTDIVGVVATLSDPSYNVAVTFEGGVATFVFDRALENNVRLNYIIFNSR